MPDQLVAHADAAKNPRTGETVPGTDQRVADKLRLAAVEFFEQVGGADSCLAMAKDFCPGIETGALHADFAREGRDYLRENGLLASDATCEANALILK